MPRTEVDMRPQFKVVALEVYEYPVKLSKIVSKHLYTGEESLLAHGGTFTRKRFKGEENFYLNREMALAEINKSQGNAELRVLNRETGVYELAQI